MKIVKTGPAQFVVLEDKYGKVLAVYEFDVGQIPDFNLLVEQGKRIVPTGDRKQIYVFGYTEGQYFSYVQDGHMKISEHRISSVFSL